MGAGVEPMVFDVKGRPRVPPKRGRWRVHGLCHLPVYKPLLWNARFDALTCVESRSPLPAFKNLGRGASSRLRLRPVPVHHLSRCERLHEQAAHLRSSASTLSSLSPMVDPPIGAAIVAERASNR